MGDRILFKDETNTTDTRSVMSREFENLRVDGEKKVEPVPSPPSALDTDIPPFPIAIFDNCALLHCEDILETAIEKNVIAVLPYTVYHQLGHHAITRSEKALNMMANRVLHSIDIVENDPLFFTENHNVKKEKMEGVDLKNRHDKILKCALRVHQHMRHPKRTIWLVTNDNALRLKAADWGAPFIVIGTQKFMDKMKMRMPVMMTKEERIEYLMEADDLEKLRICLRQPKQDHTAEKEKLSTVIVKKEEKRAKRKERQQESRLQTWQVPSEMAFYDMGEKEDRMMMYEHGWAPGMGKKSTDRMMMRVADESLI